MKSRRVQRRALIFGLTGITSFSGPRFLSVGFLAIRPPSYHARDPVSFLHRFVYTVSIDDVDGHGTMFVSDGILDSSPAACTAVFRADNTAVFRNKVELNITS